MRGCAMAKRGVVVNGVRWRGVVVALLLSSAGLVVVLARQNRALEHQATELFRRLSTPQPGTFVPTFRAASLSGDSLTIGEASTGVRQVLLVFTTTCPYCLASLLAWRRIAAALQSTPPASVVGISLDSAEATARYARVHARGGTRDVGTPRDRRRALK